MLDSSLVSTVNIKTPYFNSCEENYNTIQTWLHSENPKKYCTNILRQNRVNRKRFCSTSIEYNNSSIIERNWKRRKSHRQTGFASSNPRKFRIQKRNNRSYKMTRTECYEIRRQSNDPGFYIDFIDRGNALESLCVRNRSLPQLDLGMYSNQQSEDVSPSTSHRRRHQMSGPQPTSHFNQPSVKDSSNNLNQTNHFSIQSSQTNRQNISCNSNHYQLSNEFATGATPYYQPPGQPTSSYHHSRPGNHLTNQPSIAVSSIPNRSFPHNSVSFPLVTRSYCQNTSPLRFTTYPINAYPTQPPIFTRPSVSPGNILPSNTAFNSTVHFPSIMGDVVTSAPCHQCTLITNSGINSFSNLSPMYHFTATTTAASLLTLATVSSERLQSSRLRYMPMQNFNQWHNHHPLLPATWSYSDLTTVFQNSPARTIMQQDQLAQRLLSTSANIGIQFVMITPSSVVGSNPDISPTTSHIVPMSRSDQLNPLSISRYLPIFDNLQLIEQPKTGITKQELDLIPIKKFEKVETVEGNKISEDDKERCMICLEDFCPNEVIRMLRCSHDFHSFCVEKWLKINRTCPLCRADVGISSKKL